MLRIVIPATETFDEEAQTFAQTVEITLSLEHSLVSLSKWESLFEKPFLGSQEKTNEETFAYIKCMTLPEEEIAEVYRSLTAANLDEINQYVNRKMTATWFRETKGARSREIITAERIYYWMIAYGIPFEPCQNWHLNRLLTLIKVANEEQKPKQKMNPRQIAARNRALNEQRRQQYNTRG